MECYNLLSTRTNIHTLMAHVLDGVCVHAVYDITGYEDAVLYTVRTVYYAVTMRVTLSSLQVIQLLAIPRCYNA